MRPLNYASLAVVLIVGIATFLGGAPPQRFQDAPILPYPSTAFENEAPNHLPPVESTDVVSDAQPTDPTIEQLMKLRAAIGSPLSGTLLDGDDDDQFKQFLREAIETAPKADLLPSGEITLREPNNLPDSDTSVAAASSLQSAAAALDLHAQSLDTDLPTRAARLRTLAQQMRQQAAEIRELGL